MKIGSYEFEGPFDSVEDLEDEAGLCAIVAVTDSGACLLVGTKYTTNVRETAALLVTDPNWLQRMNQGLPKFAVRYTGPYLEEDLKRAMIELESQYLIPCVL